MERQCSDGLRIEKGEKKMTNETQMLATMILEIVETTNNKWVSQPERSTVRLVDEYIESNKVYEFEIDEDGKTVKTVTGAKDEQLDRVLNHLKTSLKRDENDLDRYKAEISNKGEHQLNLIKKIVKHYADANIEE